MNKAKLYLLLTVQKNLNRIYHGLKAWNPFQYVEWKPFPWLTTLTQLEIILKNVSVNSLLLAFKHKHI